MIIDFINGNGGGGTTDTTMRASGFTGVDFENNVLSFNNLGGNEVGSVSLSGLTPDLSDYYTKSEIDAIESADTQSINTLQTAVSGNTDAISGLDTRVSANTDNISALSASTTANTENINALGIQVSANTEAIAEISGHTGGDATELQPKTAIPESGAAGTVIALNKPDEAGWTSYAAGSGKSRTQISYYVEPSENPNPDLSQRPARYEITAAYADSVDENGNYSYSNYTTVELSVDYQGNITFTNLGNFSQDGDGYSLTSDIYNTSTGEHIQKTLYMSLENGYLYFNNGQGDCPYDMSSSPQFEHYWQDMGSWDESDPENPVWQESWSEMTNGVGFQSWGIANPAKIGIYQANSGGTYVEIRAKNADYADRAGFTTLIKAYEDNGGNFHTDHFNAGDLIIPSSSDYRPRVKTGDGDGFDGDFESLAYQGDVDSVRNDLNLIDTSVLQSTTAPSNSKTEKGTIFSVNSVASSDYVSVPTTDSWLPSNSFTKAVLNVTDTSATKIQNLVISTTSDAGYCTFDFYEKITLDLTGTTPFIANDTSIDGGVSVSGNTVFSNRYPFIRLEWNSSDSQLIVYCPFTAFFNNDGQIRTFDANDNLLEVWEGNNVDFYKTIETYDTNPQIIGSQSGYVWTLLDNGEPYPQVEKIKFPADYEYADSGIRYNDTDSGIRLVYMMNFKDVNTWYTGWNKTSETDESCVLEKDFNGQTLTISATTTADKKFVELTFSDAVSFSLGWWSSRRAKDQNIYEYRNVGKPQNLVVSESVMKIVKLSQAEYDAITTKDSSTIYIII